MSRVVGLVARRELVARLRTKAFTIGTVVTLALFVGYMALTSLAHGHTSADHVGFTPQAASLAAATHSAGDMLGRPVTTTSVPDRARAERRLHSGSLDAVVTGSPVAPVVLVRSDLDPDLRRVLDQATGRAVLDARLTAAHLDSSAVNRSVASASVTVRALDAGGGHDRARLGVGLTAAVLLYMSLTVYGQMVGQGVVEEKAGRVVELLLPAVRPWQLMIGKVLGITAVGLIQLVVLLAVCVPVALASGLLALPAAVAIGTALWAVVWYLVGFLIYALLCAAAAALVSRQEEVGNTVGPVLMLLFVPLALGSTLAPGDPHSHLLDALSLVPLFAPVLFPMREAIGGVPAWEAATAVGLSLGTVVLLLWLAGRVYSHSILRAGTRVQLLNALRGRPA